MDGAFVFVGLEPHTEYLNGLDVVRDRWGFIETGHALEHADGPLARFGGRQPLMLETSVPGVFAAGDVRAGSTKQVAAAVGEGASAGPRHSRLSEVGLKEQPGRHTYEDLRGLYACVPRRNRRSGR